MGIKINKPAASEDIENFDTIEELAGKKPKKITKQVVEGTVTTVHKSGASTEEAIPVKEVVVTDNEPMANVGFSVAMTKNLGNYESVKVQVSLHMPSKTDTDSLNDTMMFAQMWVDEKMGKALEEL